MANIFPIDFEEKLTMAQDDYILFSDSEDGNKIKKAQYKNLKGEKGDKGDQGDQGIQGIQGPQGEQGIQGVQGDAATITVGTVTTGAAGSSASVVNSGTSGAAVLDFTIPQGAKGDTGATGATGPQGPQGEQGIQGIQGPQGDKGDKGDKGDAATIAVGTVSTGLPGSSATVTNSGTVNDAVFDFSIPQGDKGDKGDTGATGPQGPQGIQGDTGATGARINSAAFSGNDIVFGETDGNTVTLTDAKTTLTGPQGEKGDTGDKGDKGDKGDAGTAATITVGTTSTGAAGSSASVTNSGTSSAAVFNFTIPQGIQGVQGIQGIQGETGPQGEQGIQGEQGETGPQGPQGATGNGIASVTSSKAGKITTVTITETSGNVDTFQISDGEDGEGAGDVLGPNSSVNGNVVLFDGTTGKLIKDSGKTLPSVIDNLTSTSTTDALSANQGKVLNTSISTINGKIPSEATSSNKLADKNYVDDSINSVTAYYITKNAAGDQFATYAELNAATTFYSGGVVRTPTRNDYCIVVADEDHDNATTRYIYQGSQWEYQYTVNETAFTTAQLNALNSGITSTKVGQYDSAVSTISGYGDIVTHDASEFYSSSNPNGYTSNTGTITSVKMNGTTISSSGEADLGTVITSHQQLKTINSTSLVGTGNITVQPTLVSGTNIKTVNNATLLGSGNIAVQPTLVSGTNIKTVGGVTLLGSGDVSVGVTSVNGNTGAVTVNAYAPGNTGTTGQVLTKTASGYEYQNAPVTSVNGSTGAVTLDADDISDSSTTNKFVTASEKSTWSGKQDALTTQTAYTTKGTSTKVPTISTNTLGQVTSISETAITFPVTSVNGDTGAVTGLQTTSNLKTSLSDNSDTYYPSQKAVKTAVDAKQNTLVSGTNIKTINGNSILGSGDITISGGIQVSPNSTITGIKYVWYGTESDYAGLTQYYTDQPGDTEFHTF